MSDSTKKKIWDYLIKKGMTPQGVAGMMGNMMAESGCIPNKVEILLLMRYKEMGITYTDKSYTSAVDSGKISKDEFLHPIKPTYQYGYGLTQLTSPDRKLGLYNLVKQKGKSIGDLSCQLEYLVKELKGTFPSVWKVLCKTTNILEASNKVLKEFEMPADVSTSVQQERYSNSVNIYNQLAGPVYVRGEDLIEYYVSYMEKIAEDQSHGYSQQNRWGEPDYDCSSLTITALEKAGIPVKTKGATFTGNMANVLEMCGFRDVKSSIRMSDGSGCERGDILMYHQHDNIGHVAVYVGKGQIVHARGRSYGSPEPGDQGTEIAITAYNNPGWQHVYRYQPSGNSQVITPVNGGSYMFTVDEVMLGTKSKSAKLLQIILRGKGYKGKDRKALTLDGEAGDNTIHALRTYQKKAKLTVDGVCGQKTWKKLLMV